jgi:hypothetical protein
MTDVTANSEKTQKDIKHIAALLADMASKKQK